MKFSINFFCLIIYNFLFSQVNIYIYKMNQYDLVKYGSQAIVGALLISAYDVFVEGYELKLNGFVSSDATSMAIAVIISNLVYDISSSIVPYLNKNNFVGKLTQPVLNGIIYLYVYNMMTAGVYRGIRDNTRLAIIGSVGQLLIEYSQAPLMSLFGFHMYQ